MLQGRLGFAEINFHLLPCLPQKDVLPYRLSSPSSSLLVILSLSWLRHSEGLKHSLDLAAVLAGVVNISLSSEFVIMVRFCLLLMFIAFVGL